MKNVFACLVHENQDCVLDLVRNLRHLDPASQILLYNGGRDAHLLRRGVPFERYGAIIHPSPEPQQWGRLHGFALDCMRFCLNGVAFDSITFVDSDQLALRPGYSQVLGELLAGHPTAGLLGSSTHVHDSRSAAGPAKAAHQEIELWRPFLGQFAAGHSKFVHWTFWPSTVITRDASAGLVGIFDRDPRLQALLRNTKIWATEEVVLPTVTALLGFEIAANPSSYDVVQYRVVYSAGRVEGALADPRSFWIHPVAREMRDPVRRRIRARFGDYGPIKRCLSTAPAPHGFTSERSVYHEIERIAGWFDRAECDLLLAAAMRVRGAIVEIGSYCGRSTVVLGLGARFSDYGSAVYAIDPHEGVVGAADNHLVREAPTYDMLASNLRMAGVEDRVRIVRKRSTDVAWSGPIAMLFIDGLHDYASVCRDYHHYAPHLAPGALVAFHDYADYYPGVRAFVDELVASGECRLAASAGTLVVLEKCGSGDPAPVLRSSAETIGESSTGLADPAAEVPGPRPEPMPLVSCLMPTANRGAFVPQAIRYFNRQDYAHRELIVMDDGETSIEHLIPQQPDIRYFRLPRRHSTGIKHNLCCQRARGEIMLHWDDDDWIAPWRISYQVRQLLGLPENSLSGLSTLYFMKPAERLAWQYVYPSNERPWVAGGTFCYRKSVWQQRGFLDITDGGDTQYVWSLAAHMVRPIADPAFYVATVHRGNSGSKRTNDPRWRPIDFRRIQKLIGEDWAFYESLCAQV